MKVILVDANSNVWKAGKYCRYSQLEPLGLEYIGSYLKSWGINVAVIPQQNLSDDDFVKEIVLHKPDIIGFSSVTCTFNKALKISAEVKKILPSVICIFGGYHVSAIPEVYKNHKEIDFVVMGEGEKPFFRLIESIRHSKNIRKLPKIFSNLMDDIQQSSASNIDESPWPLRKREILESCRIHSLIYPPPSEQKGVASIIFSQGCPYNCIFCASPIIWGKKVKFRNPEDVVNEIISINREYDIKLFFFADCTFNLNKKRIINLCNQLINRKISLSFYCMCSLSHIDEEILLRMKQAGVVKIAYGLESLNNSTVKRIKPSHNQTLRRVKKILQLTYDKGILIRGFFMIGYPWESEEDLKQIVKTLKTLPLDDIRISFLTPFPGTQIYEEFKKAKLLLTEDFSKYTTEEPVVKTPIPVEKLRRYPKIIAREFYLSREYELRMKKRIKRFPFLKQSYDEFFKFLYEQGILE